MHILNNVRIFAVTNIKKYIMKEAKIPSLHPYYVYENGKVLNRFFKEVKGSKVFNCRILNYCTENYCVTNSERKSISIQRLVWNTYKDTPAKDDECVIVKDLTLENPFALDNLELIKKTDVVIHGNITAGTKRHKSSFYYKFNDEQTEKLKKELKIYSSKWLAKVYCVSEMAIYRARVKLKTKGIL